MHVSPVAGVAVPGKDICYSVSGPRSSFSKMRGCPTPPPCRPPFHRPSPAAAPPFASKPQINGQQNSVPLTVPCGATHQELSLKSRNNEKRKEEKRSEKEGSEQGSMEVGGKGGVKSGSLTNLIW